MSILDNVKAVIAIANNLGNVDLAREVRGLETELDGLLDENRRLREENAALSDRLQERLALSWDDSLNAYVHVLPGSGWVGPYCPACHDGTGRTVHMAREDPGYRCTVCGHFCAAAERGTSMA